MSKDASNTMNITAGLSEMMKGNEATRCVRNSHIESQNTNIDIKRSTNENMSFNRESERSSQYDMEQFKSALERQVQEFMKSQQPVIQQQAQQMRKILEAKASSGLLLDS